MASDTGRAAGTFDDLPDPAWEVGADDLAVRTANAAARAAGIAVGDLPEQLPTTPASRDEARGALRAMLRSGRARHDLDLTLSGVRYAVDLVRVLDDDGRARGVLAQARAVPEPARLHPLPTAGDEPGRAPAEPAGQAADGGSHPGGHHPARVPVTGGFRLAAHRVTAAGPDLSGEWFGAEALARGRLALVVGGVGAPEPGGAGVPVVVGALRAVLTEALRSGEPLAQAVRRTDAAAAEYPGGHGATLSVAVLDPSTADVEHVSRGHHPPLLCDGSGPLGVGAPESEPRVDPLEPGSALVLCSAGLVEQPGRPLTTGVDELAGRVGRSWRGSDAPTAADTLCARVLDGLPGHATGVLMAATVPGAPARAMDTRIAADPRRIVDVRERVDAWLRETGVPADARAAVPIVAAELVTNAVQHAYPPDVGGPVRVRAAQESPAVLVLTVSDDGGWVGPPAAPSAGGRRGFGLAVVRELADDLDIDAGPRGTTVRARFASSRPVVAHPGDRRHLRLAEPAFGVLPVGDPPTRLRVYGPVGSAAAGDLRSALLQATAGGTRAITLDLAEATVLGAAAIRVLHEFAGFTGPSPAVRAPEGSVARALLAIAGLGDLLDDAGTGTGGDTGGGAGTGPGGGPRAR